MGPEGVVSPEAVAGEPVELEMESLWKTSKETSLRKMTNNCRGGHDSVSAG